jgi:IclR family transcriptional regulator, acetate operon repressor
MAANINVDAPAITETGGDRLGSLAKAIDIMEAVVTAPIPPSASGIAEQLNYAKPTAHRIVSGLREFGLLEREIGNAGLTEGRRLITLAINVLNSASSRGPRRAILQGLVERVGETCNLGVLADGVVVYIDRVEAQWPLTLRVEPGRRVPLHCTAIGKTLLAMQPQRSRNRYLNVLELKPHTPDTIVDPARLQGELDEVRANDGLAFDNQEFLSGVICAAVPIHTRDRRLVAALGVTAPRARWSLDSARGHVPALFEAASRLGETFSSD